ncbi:membrane hypothetical protein [Gammaproteobacteria bacterium]
MVVLLNSLALALLVTTVTVFRFGVKSKRWILFYFIFVFSIAWALDAWLSQEKAIGLELAGVLLVIWGLFSIAILVIRRMEE